MKVLRKILGFVNLFAVLLLLLAAFSDYVSPFRAMAFSYLGLFFPFILGFALLTTIVCLLFRIWKTSIVSGIIFIICSGSIFSYFPINNTNKEIPEGSIKILSYNVMRFEWLKNHTEEEPNPVVQYIVDSNADIICIQEFAASTDNSKLDLEDLKKVFKNTPYYHVGKLRSAYEKQEYGIAIFSKFPITKTERIHFESKYNGAFYAELDINGEKVSVYNIHLESNSLSMDERNEYEDLTRQITTKKLEHFTQSMFKRLNPAFKKRALQAQQIDKKIKEDKNKYIIVCGDFNDTPISYSHHKIQGKLKDAFKESGKGMGITYNRHRFLFRIDNIFHSKNIKSYNFEVGKLKNSDHYPISTHLHFNSPEDL